MRVIGGNSFSWMVKVKWFVTGSSGEMVCHAWNGRWFVIDGLAKMFCDGGMTAMISHGRDGSAGLS